MLTVGQVLVQGSDVSFSVMMKIYQNIKDIKKEKNPKLM